jgi:hypothetical protein
MFQAREQHAFLNRYPRGWPVEEFLKTYLKNKRAYARRQGYLTESTNQKQGRHDEDEEQNEDEEQKEQDDDEQKMQDDDEEEDEEDDMQTEL